MTKFINYWAFLPEEKKTVAKERMKAYSKKRWHSMDAVQKELLKAKMREYTRNWNLKKQTKGLN